MAGREIPSLALSFQLLGLPFRAWAEDEELAALLVDCFAAERFDPAGGKGVEEALFLELCWASGEAGDGAPWAFRPEVTGERLRAELGHGTLWADRSTGRARSCLDPRLRAHGEDLRANGIECPALFLASGRRVALHGAMVAPPGGGWLLLLGRSGAGKSSLAYGALRAGWDYLAEEVVYGDPADPTELHGHPRRLWLLPEARAFFPELADCELGRTPNGGWKMGLDPATASGRVRRRGRVAHVIVLEGAGAGRQCDGGGRGAAVGPRPGEAGPGGRFRSPGELLECFESLREGAFAASADYGEVARGLSREGGWSLARGDTPQETLARLEALLGEVG